MNQNEKPQGINLGQSNHLDDESINTNVTPINRLKPNDAYVFGESSPLITDLDIVEHELFSDEARRCDSLAAADELVRSLGLTPVHSRADMVRFHRYQCMRKSWKDYAGGMR